MKKETIEYPTLAKKAVVKKDSNLMDNIRASGDKLMALIKRVKSKGDGK